MCKDSLGCKQTLRNSHTLFQLLHHSEKVIKHRVLQSVGINTDTPHSEQVKICEGKDTIQTSKEHVTVFSNYEKG